MVNDLDLLFSNSRHGKNRLLTLADRLSRTYYRASKTIAPLDTAHPLVRWQVVCAMYSSLKAGIDPDISYLSVQTQIPRQTLQRWLAVSTSEGRCDLVREGKRKVLVINPLYHQDIIDHLDYIADYALFGREDAPTK